MGAGLAIFKRDGRRTLAAATIWQAIILIAVYAPNACSAGLY